MTRPSTARRRRDDRSGDLKTVRAWSDLPDESLHAILTRLCSFVDFLSFSSVCRSWRAVASSLSPSQVTSLFPPLLLCPTFSRSRRSRLISSIRVLDPASPSFSSTLSPNNNKFQSVTFLSYSHGHLLALWQNRILILNPFTGNEFCSPLLPPGHISHSSSPVFTSSLASPNSGILLCIFNSLFYWRIGSPSWSRYSPTTKPSIIKPCGDITVITVQGKVYLMDSLDAFFEVDLSPQLNLRPLGIEGITGMHFSVSSYLVDCGGELLLLLLTLTEQVIYVDFEVFRLDMSANRARWVKQETLGNWAIFVGYNRLVPALAFENPEKWGGRSNCVYFATGNVNNDLPWVVTKLGDMINTTPSNIEGIPSLVHFGNQISSAWVHPGF